MVPDRRKSFLLSQMDSLNRLIRRVHFFISRVTVARQRSFRRYSQNFIDTWSRRLRWRQQKLVRESEHLLRSSGNGLFSEPELKRMVCRILEEFVLIFADEDTIDVRRLGGAMTNRVFVVSSPGNDTVLLRLYGRGTELLFERDRELDTFRRLSELSFGPKLLGTFRGGRVEEYIESTTLKKHDLRDPATSCEIAVVLARLHGAIPPPADAPSELWMQIFDWCVKAREAAHLIQDNPCAINASDWNVRAFVEDIYTESLFLKQALERTPSPVVFGHNDAQYGNIIRRATDGKIMLIDYEYAKFNNRGFDIGNHFCEWAADYDVDDAHVLHFDCYPTEEEQLRFVHAYLCETHPTFNNLSEAAQKAEREAVRVEANRYGLASHLLWSLWGVIQAAHSTIEFNFLEYANQRFLEYMHRRDETLADKPGLCVVGGADDTL